MTSGVYAEPVIHVTRVPLLKPGNSGWFIIMAMLEPRPPTRDFGGAARKTTTAITSTGLDEENATSKDGKATYLHEDSYAASSKMNSWAHLKHTFLSRSKASASVLVSRTMVITMLVATDERPVLHYTDASDCKGPLSRAKRTRVRPGICARQHDTYGELGGARERRQLCASRV